MRLDAHHSFTERYPLIVLETILKRNRFDGSILVAEAVDFASLPEFVRGVVIQTDAADPRLLDEYRRDVRFRGVCALACDFADLAACGLTLDFPGPLGAVPALAELHPGLRIAIPNLGNPEGEFDDRRAEALAAAAHCPNVYCKLSGIVGNRRQAVEHAIRCFGPERLMFGSNWPAHLPEHAWKASLAGFTQSIGARTIEFREQLLGGTAARFYGIGQ